MIMNDEHVRIWKTTKSLRTSGSWMGFKLISPRFLLTLVTACHAEKFLWLFNNASSTTDDNCVECDEQMIMNDE
jgi:hypothetical protein